MRKHLACAALCLMPLAACTTASTDASPGTLPQVEQAGGTQILDAAAADRLLAAKGITLQWIGWNDRGMVNVRRVDGTIYLTGTQADPAGPGRLFVDGRVTEIGADYFLFDGVVRISETPDAGRKCELDKQWRFGITQNRPYWRLREFEWCDGLTDYVDIYF